MDSKTTAEQGFPFCIKALSPPGFLLHVDSCLLLSAAFAAGPGPPAFNSTAGFLERKMVSITLTVAKQKDEQSNQANGKKYWFSEDFKPNNP